MSTIIIVCPVGRTPGPRPAPWPARYLLVFQAFDEGERVLL